MKYYYKLLSILSTLICCLLLPSTLLAQSGLTGVELITNGGFEEDLNVGWTLTTAGQAEISDDVTDGKILKIASTAQIKNIYTKNEANFDVTVGRTYTIKGKVKATAMDFNVLKLSIGNSTNFVSIIEAFKIANETYDWGDINIILDQWITFEKEFTIPVHNTYTNGDVVNSKLLISGSANSTPSEIFLDNISVTEKDITLEVTAGEDVTIQEIETTTLTSTINSSDNFTTTWTEATGELVFASADQLSTDVSYNGELLTEDKQYTATITVTDGGTNTVTDDVLITITPETTYTATLTFKNESNTVLNGVNVLLSSNNGFDKTFTTTDTGILTLNELKAGSYTLIAEKDAYVLQQEVIEITDNYNQSITLSSDNSLFNGQELIANGNFQENLDDFWGTENPDATTIYTNDHGNISLKIGGNTDPFTIFTKAGHYFELKNKTTYTLKGKVKAEKMSFDFVVLRFKSNTTGINTKDIYLAKTFGQLVKINEWVYFEEEFTVNFEGEADDAIQSHKFEIKGTPLSVDDLVYLDDISVKEKDISPVVNVGDDLSIVAGKMTEVVATSATSDFVTYQWSTEESNGITFSNATALTTQIIAPAQVLTAGNHTVTLTTYKGTQTATDELVVSLIPNTYKSTFTIKNESDELLEDAVVSIANTDGFEQSKTTVADGIAEFTDLAIGEYTYSVEKEDFVEATGTVNITDADITERVTLTAKEVFINGIELMTNGSFESEINDGWGVTVADQGVIINDPTDGNILKISSSSEKIQNIYTKTESNFNIIVGTTYTIRGKVKVVNMNDFNVLKLSIGSATTWGEIITAIGVKHPEKPEVFGHIDGIYNEWVSFEREIEIPEFTEDIDSTNVTYTAGNEILSKMLITGSNLLNPSEETAIEIYLDDISFTEKGVTLTTNAGEDFEMFAGATQQLTASVNSSDDFTYLWTAPEGITLSSSDILNPTITSDESIDVNTQFTLSLTASNVNFTSTDEIIITVNPIEKFNATLMINDESLNIVEGAIVQLTNETSVNISATSDASGNVIFTEVPEGTYTYVINKDGFISLIEELILNEDTELDIILKKYYTSLITLQNIDGNLLEDGIVSLSNEEGSIETKNSDENGEVLFTDLLAGSYIYEIIKTGFLTFNSSFEIIDESNTKGVTLVPELIVDDNTLTGLQLVNNGDFEQGVDLTWAEWKDDVTLSESNDVDDNSGSKSMKIHTTGRVRDIFLRNDYNFDLVIGKTYTIKGKIKAENMNFDYLDIIVYPTEEYSDKVYTRVYSPENENTPNAIQDEWVSFEKTIQIPYDYIINQEVGSSVTSTIKINGSEPLDSSEGSILLDEIYIQEIGVELEVTAGEDVTIQEIETTTLTGTINSSDNFTTTWTEATGELVFASADQLSTNVSYNGELLTEDKQFTTILTVTDGGDNTVTDEVIISVTPERKYTATFTFINESNTVLNGVNVLLSSNNGFDKTFTTTDTGILTLNELKAGSYTLIAEKDAYVLHQEVIEITDNYNQPIILNSDNSLFNGQELIANGNFQENLDDFWGTENPDATTIYTNDNGNISLKIGGNTDPFTIFTKAAHYFELKNKTTYTLKGKIKAEKMSFDFVVLRFKSNTTGINTKDIYLAKTFGQLVKINEWIYFEEEFTVNFEGEADDAIQSHKFEIKGTPLSVDDLVYIDDISVTEKDISPVINVGDDLSIVAGQMTEVVATSATSDFVTYQWSTEESNGITFSNATALTTQIIASEEILTAENHTVTLTTYKGTQTATDELVVNLIPNSFISTFTIKNESDELLEDATVSIVNAEGFEQSKTTMADGIAEFTELVLGEYTYSVEKENFVKATGTVNITDVDIIESVTLTTVIPGTYIATFSVIDIEDNILEDASIQLKNEIGVDETVITDATGQVTFANLLAGEYTYSVTKDGFVTEEDSITIIDSNITEVVTLEIQVIDPITYTASFTVKDAEALPISASTVVLTNNTAVSTSLVTDENGEVAFTSLSTGLYSYTVSKNGYTDITGSIEIVDQDITTDILLIEIIIGTPITGEELIYNGSFEEGTIGWLTYAEQVTLAESNDVDTNSGDNSLRITSTIGAKIDQIYPTSNYRFNLKVGTTYLLTGKVKAINMNFTPLVFLLFPSGNGNYHEKVKYTIDDPTSDNAIKAIQDEWIDFNYEFTVPEDFYLQGDESVLSTLYIKAGSLIDNTTMSEILIDEISLKENISDPNIEITYDNSPIFYGDTKELTASHAATSDVLTYLWEAPEGITLSSTSDPVITITSTENLEEAKEYAINLTVLKEGNIIGVSTAVITAIPVIIANAGADQGVIKNSLVTLDGSGSTSTATLTWTAPEGVTLSDINAVNPTFTAPEVDIATDFVFELKAEYNNNGFLDIDEVTIVVYPELNAHAGDDIIAFKNTLITLDASATIPQNVVLEWVAPDGIILSDINAVHPTFTTPDVAELTDFTFVLKAMLNGVKQQDEVVVTVLPEDGPTANAGEDITGYVGEEITLDASTSSPVEVTYEWIAPNGIELSDNFSATPTFIPPFSNDEKTYTFIVRVSLSGVMDTDTVSVTILPRELPTGIEDLESNFAKCYPNPTTDNAYLELQKEAKVIITDINGRMMQSLHLYPGKHKIDISTYNSGVYIIQVLTPENKMALKLIKK
ncbi:T9SS type A sorting domain-containing protein [Flammeovirga pectinis]|uniref:T9SS type A sorting domain-containing protein n=1 Tax=Flammeovirga pectinis TaxID=2494373 RepID=A0A3S9P759_9BACT|nr:carboxypeptidase regulatory-like domain-containing protein [Flammeovirga pectinis]AZQ63984.1 T9SS type A sorting domain-containing protein [Flammeovirga pectinis]